MIMVSMRLLAVALSFSPLALAVQVQKPGLTLPPGADASREQVKQIFTSAFGAYQKFASSHDELTPVTKVRELKACRNSLPTSTHRVSPMVVTDGDHQWSKH